MDPMVSIGRPFSVRDDNTVMLTHDYDYDGVKVDVDAHDHD